jgi:hypothetical protein
MIATIGNKGIFNIKIIQHGAKEEALGFFNVDSFPS